MAVNKKSGIVGIAICVVLLIICLVINIVFATMSNAIATFLGGYSSSAISSDAKYDLTYVFNEGYDVSTRIGEEGMVMLKNENKALPLKESEGVALLGAMSYNHILGGTGSAGGKDDENTVSLYKAFVDAGIKVNEKMWTWLENACGGARMKTTNPDYLAAGEPEITYDSGNKVGWTAYTQINEFSRDTYEQFAKPLIGDSTTAIVTFSRSGAEGASPSMDIDNTGSTMNRTILQLSDKEMDLLKFAKENFDKTIVLINSATPLECGFLDEEQYGVDAAMWIGHTGEAGVVGLANLLVGTVSPSGALVDTYSYDHSTNPTYFNMDNNKYANAELNGNKAQGFYQYEEGIYVGYKYYETADSVGYFDSDTFKNIQFKNGKVSGGYDSVVQYPFGYGLSYTTFTQEIVNSSIDLTAGGENSITVSVKNTGSYAGKEIVQLYLEAPYATDKEHFGIKGKGLEKAKVSLIGFAKTPTIEPGDTKSVTINFSTDDLASFDNFGQGCYVLENGVYNFNIQDNAHCWAKEGDNAAYDSVSATLNNAIIYKPAPESGAVAGATYVEKRDSDAQTALNAMDDVTAGDGNMLDGYLSRSNIADGMAQIMKHQSNETPNEILPENIVNAILTTGKNYYDYKFTTYIGGVKTELTKRLYGHGNDVAPYMETTPDGLSVNDESYKVEWNKVYYVEEDEEGKVVSNPDGTFAVYEDPAQIESGKYHKLSCDDMGYVPVGHELWDQLASMTSLEEAITVQGKCGWAVPAVDSVNKLYTGALDGPGEVANAKYNGATWWPCAVTIAATWNLDLIKEQGVAYGNQAVLFQVSAVYAPAMNLHRSPFGGRNFEYYSEDGFISGKVGGTQVAGIQSTGTSVFIKHFTINDSDTNRSGCLTWANEQAIREIYALPFEISCKEYDADGIMASMNRIGMSWAHYGMHTTMVRDEWGWNGFFITDSDGTTSDAYNNTTYWLYGAEGGMLNTNCTVDSAETIQLLGDGATKTNYGQYKLHQTMKHALYQYSRSGKIEGYQAWWWVWIWVVQNVVFLGVIALIVIFKVVPAFRNK